MFSSAGQVLYGLFAIILVNVVLSGDNAVVIALAVKPLPGRQRYRALIGGAAGAVLVRVGATFFAGELLHVEFLKLIGGITILWIAVKLFSQAARSEASPNARPASFWHAIWYIMIADVTMSLDNILAIAQVAQGNLTLLIFGLGLSIPLILFASGLLATLLDKYPLIIYLGAALLGKIGAEMILTDDFVVQLFTPTAVLRYAAEAAAAAGVLIVGRLLLARSVDVAEGG